MNGIRLAAVAAVAGTMAIGAIGSAFAADKANASKYFVYKTEQGCSVVVDANKKTPGKKMAGPFKSPGGADKRIAKLTKEKKC